ncbi:MAG: hypothetical protein MUE58_08555 [Chitinophagaceae bacterium]|jgi:hypothetical protein|nr:hypothetical protein [Chitinophagaceae bacterium]
MPFVMQAQEKKPSYSFESYNALGWLGGDQTVHGLIQSVNGVSLGPVFAGAGLGLDFYRVRSVPLFFDLRYRYGKGKNKWLAYGDAGYHFPWDKGNDILLTGGSEQSFDGGFYFDAGVGYQLQLAKKGALFFTAGYSEKRMSEWVTVIPFCPGPGLCEPRTDYIDYTFRRYAFKIGWKF